MVDKEDIKKIKEITENFFQKTTITPLSLEASVDSAQNKDSNSEAKEVVNLNINIEEPSVLIGERGQTLFEIQRLLRSLLIKKTQKFFYLNLDINNYKQKKLEYIRKVAKEAADDVSLTKIEKTLPPMSAYERRMVHSELSQRQDIITESEGEGIERHIIIKPR